MSPHRDLDVLDAAEQVADEVNELLDAPRARVIHRTQLRNSAQSVPANIAEGFAKDARPDRNKSLRIAKGEAEETIRHLRANYASQRIDRSVYWRVHNRLVTIVKMLNALLA